MQQKLFSVCASSSILRCFEMTASPWSKRDLLGPQCPQCKLNQNGIDIFLFALIIFIPPLTFLYQHISYRVTQFYLLQTLLCIHCAMPLNKAISPHQNGAFQRRVKTTKHNLGLESLKIVKSSGVLAFQNQCVTCYPQRALSLAILQRNMGKCQISCGDNEMAKWRVGQNQKLKAWESICHHL